MSNPAPFIPPVMSDVVIDLYHGDKLSVDFSAVKAAGIAAVILKATQGSGFVDPTFAPRLTDARAAGMLVGAYHFLDGSSPVEQMAHFLSVVGNTNDVLLALDFEAYEASQASVTQAASAINAVKAVTGRFPVLYTNRYMVSAPNPILSQCSLWLPNMVPTQSVRRAGPNGNCGSTPMGRSAVTQSPSLASDHVTAADSPAPSIK